MHPKFKDLIESLEPSLQQLLACPPHSGATRLPLSVPKGGVYLFSSGGTHLYVGRTDRLRARHREHWNGRHNDAPFAFKLARHKTGMIGKGGPTRRDLSADPSFMNEFVLAKEMVAMMEFRWVAEPDPDRQCLLEIYTAIALETLHNDFKNH